MDLAKLGKKAIFVPTPRQFEQLYLAKIFDDNLIAYSVSQDKLSESSLSLGHQYSGFRTFDS
ncbi:glycosyltransferase [Winogradskyella sp.]|uniref:glycosyltransferase n=1 Tax=Winogradskyella sp. TaxID=1883156 RepID=UPI003413C1B1